MSYMKNHEKPGSMGDNLQVGLMQIAAVIFHSRWDEKGNMMQCLIL